MIVRFEALGPITVETEGGSARLRPAQRRLLAILLLDVGRWVNTETLIDRMWGDSPPGNARGSLHVHLSSLRRQVPDVIATASHGYRLELDGHSFDIHEFTDLVDQASAAVENEQFASAAELSSAALSLWRGLPYQELEEVDAARAERFRLEELRSAVEITNARALMRASRTTEAIAQLRSMVGDQPMNEAIWEELIHAYYLAGRQANALAAFAEVKEMLADELGLEPGPRLVDLEDRILVQDPTLTSGNGRPSAQPDSIAGVRVVALPRFTTPFVGREDAVRRLSKAMAEQRLITLVGVGGIGKTRLAVEAAGRFASEFPGGTSFVGLDGVEDARFVDAAIAEAIDHRGHPTPEALADTIGQNPRLLVIDNCEHLAGSVAATLLELLQRCSSLRIVTTSRVPLRVVGETVWQVPPLETPAEDAPVSELNHNESVVFFAEAARRVDQNFTIGADNADGVRRICRGLAGIPLALELAASRCDVLTATDLAATLDQDHVVRDEHGRPSRHSSLDQMVEWSVGLLEPLDRRLFERLSVFAGAADRRAIAAVCGVEGTQLTDSLQRLARSSLITVDLTGRTAHFAQLPPIREAAARRVPADTSESLEKAHTAHYLTLATDAAPGPGSEAEHEWFDRLDSAIEDIRAAFDHAQVADPLAGLVAATNMLPFWYRRNRVPEGTHHLRTFRDLADNAREEHLAAAIKAEGTLAYVESDLAGARRLLLDALSRFAALDDAAGVGATLNNLGGVAVDSGDLEEALAQYQQARQTFEQLDDRRGLAVTSLNIGVVELQREQSTSAREWFLRALDEFRRLGDRAEEAHALERIAHVAYYEGDLGEAKEWMHASRAIYLDLGLTDAVARSDWLLAGIARDGGDTVAAADLAAEAAATVRAIDHRSWWVPSLLETSAYIAHAGRETALAAVLAGAASAFRRHTGTARPAFATDAHTEFVRSIRDHLGPSYSALTARGEAMTVDQALELVAEQLRNRTGARARTL